MDTFIGKEMHLKNVVVSKINKIHMCKHLIVSLVWQNEKTCKCVHMCT